MCVAVPLRVLEVHDDPLAPTAVVDLGGARRSVSLKVVDRIPEVGEYLLVHAGFAIHTISREAARESLELLAQASGGEGPRGE